MGITSSKDMRVGNRWAALMVPCAGWLLQVAASDAWAQAYPSRPIRMVVGLAPGGGTDLTARIFSQRLTEQLGVPVLVDNRPGAGSMVGTEIVAKAPPDGYTLLTASPEFAINPSLVSKVPYDAVRDFAPISQLTSGQYFLSTHPTVPVKSVRDLIALARARPGQLNYGSSGNGSANHLAGVLFQGMTGTRIVHVPFKGANPAAIALMSGEIDFMFSSTSAAMTHVISGKLRAIAVTGPKRYTQMPEIPTISESGVPGFEVTGWYAMFAPAGTSREIIARLHAEIVKAAQNPAVRERYAALGAEPVGSTPEECAAFIRAEIDKWAKVVKASGARPD